MTFVIDHNPDCGTSRNVLSFIRASGTEPVIIEYLRTGWTRPQLLGLFAAADLAPRSALRVAGTPAEDLGLLDPAVGDEDLREWTEHGVMRRVFCLRRSADRREPRPL